jgi:exodeoxyribonuclease V alpha subunit
MKLSDIDELFIKYKETIATISRYANKHLSNNSHLAQEINDDIRDDNKIDQFKFKQIIQKGCITKTNINAICNYIKNTHKTKFLLQYIIINPYKFVYVSTSPLIPYEKAKLVSEFFNSQVDHEEKDKAWIHEYILTKNTDNSFYVPKNIIMTDYWKYFKKEFNTNVLDKLCIQRFFNKKEYYTSPKFDYIETFIAKGINKKNTINYLYNHQSINSFIEVYEKDNCISINDEQRDCIHKMIKHNILMVSGFPGVGKSTIVNIYCEYAKRHFNFDSNDKIYVVAPTGMAVKSVKSKISNILGIVETSTIHKLIFTTSQSSYTQNISTLIIDESSMINTLLMFEVMKIVKKYDCNVIFLGDTNQLPPIGIGEPFKYFLNCKTLYKCHLEQIQRQKDNQLKETIKHMIVSPSMVSIDDFDNISMIFEHTNTFDYDYLQSISQKYGLHELNSKFVSPSHKYDSGVKNINVALQRIYNNDTFDTNGHVKTTTTLKNSFETKQFKVDDLVLLTKNISNTDHVNGDFFKLISIQGGDKEKFTLRKCDSYPNDTLIIDKDEMFDNYQLGYCCTVHKTQGSQYENIIIVIDENHLYQWSKQDAINLLYTAISRAQKRCIILGNKKVFYKALYSRQSHSSKQMKTPLSNIINLIV